MNLSEQFHFIPGKLASDSASSIFYSQYVDLLDLNHLTFAAIITEFGTSAAGDTFDVSIEVTTAAGTAAGSAAAFYYRLSSSALGADEFGDVTSRTSTEVAALTSAATGCILLVDVDPAQVESDVPSARWVRLVITPPDSDNSVTNASCLAIGVPRHVQTTFRSTTA
jgi:hypothetical protein